MNNSLATSLDWQPFDRLSLIRGIRVTMSGLTTVASAPKFFVGGFVGGALGWAGGCAVV